MGTVRLTAQPSRFPVSRLLVMCLPPLHTRLHCQATNQTQKLVSATAPEYSRSRRRQAWERVSAAQQSAKAAGLR
jgi:hypothetical protein